MSFDITKENSADDRTTLQKIVKLTLTDATNFIADGDITGDGVGGNDGVGTIQSKSGNVVYVIVESGDFVAGNDVDNANPYAAIDTGIVSLDETYWEVIYQKKNRNINTAFLYLDFTKNLANLVIQAYFSDTNQSDKYYPLTKKDSSGNITLDPDNILSSEKYRLIYNHGKNEEYIKFIIKPSSIIGTDILTVGISENNFSM